MTDPHRSRGAPRRAALALAVVAAASPCPALASEDAATRCVVDLAAAQSLVSAWGGGALTRIDDELVAGLRAIDVDSAESDVAQPVALSDRAFVAALPGGMEAYVFALGDRVCGGIEILPAGGLPALAAAAGPKL